MGPWQRVRRRARGSTSGRSSNIVCCQELPPTAVKLPGRVIPMASRASCVSAPPTTPEVPSVRPISAACAVMPPITVPAATTLGKISRSSPQVCTMRSDQSARESAFGQAQTSSSCWSYKTMPSRMLVALTAATASGPV